MTMGAFVVLLRLPFIIVAKCREFGTFWRAVKRCWYDISNLDYDLRFVFRARCTTLAP